MGFSDYISSRELVLTERSRSFFAVRENKQAVINTQVIDKRSIWLIKIARDIDPVGLITNSDVMHRSLNTLVWNESYMLKPFEGRKKCQLLSRVSLKYVFGSPCVWKPFWIDFVYTFRLEKERGVEHTLTGQLEKQYGFQWLTFYSASPLGCLLNSLHPQQPFSPGCCVDLGFLGLFSIENSIISNWPRALGFGTGVH